MPNTDPPSPPRSHSFPTCPEDNAGPRLPSSTPWHQARQDQPSEMEMHQDHDDDGVQPVPVGPHDPGTAPAADSMMIDDEPQSATSSRSETLSPGPRTGTTATSSPPPTAELDPMKQTDTEEDTQSSRGRLAGVRLGTGESARRQPSLREAQSSMTTESDKSIDNGALDRWEDELSATAMDSDYSCMRVIPTSPSSFLRAGSRFHGTQQSERQVYDVHVEIKHVDLRESFLCGYLRIQGLTEDHPTLTTYFEGEIIGTKYSFITNHESWGASDKTDLSHWTKFSAFRPFHKHARKGPVFIRDPGQRENIFMRWKEHFLVPDHRVRTIVGASFEGFYYICFNQVKGEVSGIYFHSKSERFQQLELKHEEDRGCFSALEFR